MEFHYYQLKGGEEVWKKVPDHLKDKLVAEAHPMFVTVLAVDKLVEDLTHEDRMKLRYRGKLYFDFDSQDEDKVIEKTNQFLDKLAEMRVDLECCSIFTTGGRGFHVEVPQELFLEKKALKEPITQLPAIYREMALALVVDTLDLQIYSTGRGRMWRQPNVQRDNGRYKVPITLAEMREMTPGFARLLSSEPRPLLVPKPVTDLCIDLSVLYEESKQKVDELLKRRGKFKADPAARDKAQGPSVELLMAGFGVKEGTGFHPLALQLSIVAHTAGWKEDDLVEKCAGLIANHESDGVRYNTPEKRAEELRRMWRYMNENVCYEFSVGGLKSLMSHAAPDLDGIPATKEDVKEVIAEAEAEDELADVDEYDDVARGITLNKYGVWAASTEGGKKRVCAISFANQSILMSIETCQIVGYETDILVNGKPRGRQVLELDVFQGLVSFNRFAAKYGHTFTGSDAQVRVLMMRFVEQAKKKGGVQYIIKREGLDLVRIPHHEDPLFHEPFLVWADGHTVVMQPNVKAAGLDLTFAGFPNPQGIFRTDISQAPALADFLAVDTNKAQLREMLRNLLTCQKPELLGKYLGWYSACFWRQLFHAAYEKFPILHVNGAAGAGKTEMTVAIANLFSYRQPPKVTSPGSSLFAIAQMATGSSSLPLIIDEYKPHEMPPDVRNKFRATFRDAYNQRDSARGGGNRDSDDYRILNVQQLSSPIVFIAEATEDETAVMERVVLATVVRPAPSVALRWLHRFQAFNKHRHLLGMLGQYLAMDIVNGTTIDSFREEFDALYQKSQARYMITEADLAGGLSDDELREKQNAKERTVYNHTVAAFGFSKFRALVNTALGGELDELLGECETGIYGRMADLQATTTPEWVRTLEAMSSMTFSVDPESGLALRQNHEYGFDEAGNLELDVRTCHMRYRKFMKDAGMTAYFASFETFSNSLRDTPIFLRSAIPGQSVLKRPGVVVLNVEEMQRFGVASFKQKE